MEELIKIIFQEAENIGTLALPDPSLLQFYSDLKNRVYWIQGEVDSCLLDLVSKIITWNQDDRDISIEKRTPIKIYFYSNGGDLEVTETLLEIFKASTTPIIGYALGPCSSAASMIFLACHKRYALSNATFVFHKGGCRNMGGDFQQVQSAMDDYRKKVDRLISFYKENTTFPPDLIEEKLNGGDWYIKTDEAVQNGVIDEVITDLSVLL